MISSRYFVVKYISWEVNNSMMVKFWRDSWNGALPLIKTNLSQDFLSHSERLWGCHLVDFVSAVCLFSRKVIWKDPDELPVSDKISKDCLKYF